MVLSPLPSSTRSPSAESATDQPVPESPVPKLGGPVITSRQHANAIGRERNRTDAARMRDLRHDLDLRPILGARAETTNIARAARPTAGPSRSNHMNRIPEPPISQTMKTATQDESA